MKAQSALEFLMNYSWAFLILTAVLVALIGLGVFNSSSVSAQECLIPNSFSCIAFQMSTNGLLQLNLRQFTEAPINITSLTCNQNGTVVNMQKPYNPPSNQIFLPIGGNYTFAFRCYTNANTLFTTTGGTTFSGYVIVNYTNEVAHLSSIAVGRVIVKPT